MSVSRKKRRQVPLPISNKNFVITWLAPFHFLLNMCARCGCSRIYAWERKRPCEKIEIFISQY
uniref:Uncharacterized protein n=1 Tax=Rhizophora mucronata TaxID=61149 RepID=A0A2P2QB87_RHIMU